MVAGQTGATSAHAVKPVTTEYGQGIEPVTIQVQGMKLAQFLRFFLRTFLRIFLKISPKIFPKIIFLNNMILMIFIDSF